LKNIAAIWAVSAVATVFMLTVFRLSQHALVALQMPLSIFEWSLLCANVIFMAYYEGYRGFQKGFAPRFAARARYLRDHGTAFEMILAPFFCFGYFGTTRRRQIVAFAVSFIIFIVATGARMLPQPWRGILDAGVVVGLFWGTVSLVIFVYIALKSEHYTHSAEILSSR
jgi:hypothetical protein